MFTHFDCVDAVGHSLGSKSSEYKDAIKYVDALIGRIYTACVEKGWQDDTLFICISDHGHEKDGGHGNNDKIVREVTFAVAGGKGNIVNGKPAYTVTQDMASVVFYALGEVQPSIWDGSVPRNMFVGI